MMEPRNGEFPQIQSAANFLDNKESLAGFFLRVTADAVIGGGFDLRFGQVLNLAEAGDYANVLLGSGACEIVHGKSSDFADLI